MLPGGCIFNQDALDGGSRQVQKKRPKPLSRVLFLFVVVPSLLLFRQAPVNGWAFYTPGHIEGQG
jgi:hypothetical protein